MSCQLMYNAWFLVWLAALKTWAVAAEIFTMYWGWGLVTLMGLIWQKMTTEGGKPRLLQSLFCLTVLIRTLIHPFFVLHILLSCEWAPKGNVRWCVYICVYTKVHTCTCNSHVTVFYYCAVAFPSIISHLNTLLLILTSWIHLPHILDLSGSFLNVVYPFLCPFLCLLSLLFVINLV